VALTTDSILHCYHSEITKSYIVVLCMWQLLINYISTLTERQGDGDAVASGSLSRPSSGTSLLGTRGIQILLTLMMEAICSTEMSVPT
jgi:hypothetical protein